MTKAQHRAIARKGGLVRADRHTGHEWRAEDGSAARAGRKGGLACAEKKGK